MIKTLTNLFKQDKEKFVVPKGVQDVIPVAAIFDDGIFKVGKDKYSKTYRFTDINYAVASREDKEAMFLEYSELLNSLDSGATTKITINNRRLNRLDFEQTILIPTTGDNLDEYREEYNKMLLDKATGANSIVQDKYITISINKKSVEDARTYFARVGADLIAHFGRLGSKCVELETDERLRIFHDFYRVGEESSFHFDIKETRKKGHDFKDYICPDTMEFEKDYFKMGNRYGRVLFLREYASYIKDSMVAELTDMNRNLMMSIDIVPVPTDEAVKEAENRLLGVETNITNWQRRQNANNNFSATVPYDMEQQKKEMKEFLDDLTTRDQRMMFAVITMVITADSKYGTELIKKLSKELTQNYGKGFDYSSLYKFVRFYKEFPEILDSVNPKSLPMLSWTHYRVLLQVEDKKARDWYEKEAVEQTWSVRTLQRNISSQYYYRMLKTQKKELVESEMKELTAPYQNDKLEFIKNPVVAEFLGFSQNTDFTESDLEKSILSNLQKFLMELGKGYAFVARQQHIHTEKQDYYIDLVFYNYILKCFVLIDLKTEKITHQDVGQMDMYIRMYDELKRSEGDNPTIGIVLCSDTDDDIARYSVMHGNEQLFASKYKLYLPTKEELKAEIETQKAMFYLQQQESEDNETE